MLISSSKHDIPYSCCWRKPNLNHDFWESRNHWNAEDPIFGCICGCNFWLHTTPFFAVTLLHDIWSFHKFLRAHSVRSDDVKVQGGLLACIQSNSCDFPVVNQGPHILHWFWSGDDEGNGYHVWGTRRRFNTHIGCFFHLNLKQAWRKNKWHTSRLYSETEFGNDQILCRT